MRMVFADTKIIDRGDIDWSGLQVQGNLISGNLRAFLR